MTQAPQYRAARRATRVAALLIVDDVILKVTVVDISRDGARVMLPGSVAPGTPVHLQLGVSSTPALVHWTDKGAAGLRFYGRLDGATLAAIEAADDPDANWR